MNFTTENIIIFVIVTIAAYLIGSVNSSIIISRFIGTDIRNHGSGNAGATNMLRTYGKKVGVYTLLLDALKGVIAVLLAIIVCNVAKDSFAEPFGAKNVLKCLCGIAVVLGHNYPIFFQFKGGKGISTSAAVIFMLDWRVGLIVLIGALLVMVLTRYISLGSMVGALLFPTSVCLFTFFVDKNYNYILLVTAIFMCILAICRHHANIVRLINGTESKLGQKK